ncbi:hypothetical protein PS914_03171 [Pseudomonas fluorescens]|uniref:hypothetical protein n=1 Tax=Pseudomonas fluorescens TaxID=294 RepID=UPI001258A856|nr:hypothetical protein [Pseudomonas fluorescens]VVP91497.1 hypothetical protein PS914_03171 [Pseudomonas fluorescens]
MRKYDEQLRAQAVFEQRADDPRECTERYRYGGADPACASHNQCGKLIRHDDPAGTQLFAEYGVIGGVLQQTRQLLRDLASPDWPERETDRDALLEPDTEAMTRSSYNGLGEVIAQTDAKDNRQLFSQTIAGQLREVRLQVASETAPITLVSAIEYNAHGQAEREVTGNGVITTLDYAPEDARLSRLLAKRGNTTLQDLRYEYDAAGNPLTLIDGNGLFPNRPGPTEQDEAFLDTFFSGAELKANIEVRKEIHQSATGWTVLGKTLPNPFKSRENLVSSREELQGANYSIKNGLLYRAHVSSVSPVANVGLLRNTTGSPTPEGFKEYIANVFKHTASTGSKGAVLSLSTQRNVAKGFMSKEKTLTTIDLNKLDVGMAQDFLTVPELILQYGGMMLREGRIEHSDLVKALDQLNNKEHEVFFVGQAIGLNIGEIPANAIVATKNMGQKTLKLTASP